MDDILMLFSVLLTHTWNGSTEVNIIVTSIPLANILHAFWIKDQMLPQSDSGSVLLNIKNVTGTKEPFSEIAKLIL